MRWAPRACGLPLLCAALLHGCIRHAGPAPTAAPRLDIRAAAPGLGDAARLGGHVVLTSGSWLSYDARYRIGGAVADPPRALDTVLGGEVLQQVLQTRLPSLAGDAPQIRLVSAQGSQWRLDGALPQGERRAQLSWQPAEIEVKLDWSASPDDPAAPLRCPLGGSLALDLSPQRTLAFGARDCSVDAPGRTALPLAVASWSGSWQVDSDAAQHSLDLSLFEAEPVAPSSTAASSGYELRLNQTRRRGHWTGDSALGLRHRVDPYGSDDTAWIAQAELRRRIGDVGLTAGWQRGADPLWFVPSLTAPTDQLALGLDLRPWLRRSWGGDLLEARLSYRWSEGPEPAWERGELFWNLSTSW